MKNSFIKEQFSERFISICSIIIDMIFLGIWVVGQYYFQKLLDTYQLDKYNMMVFNVFKIIFTISTLAPIIFFIYKDLKVIWIQINNEIRNIKK